MTRPAARPPRPAVLLALATGALACGRSREQAIAIAADGPAAPSAEAAASSLPAALARPPSSHDPAPPSAPAPAPRFAPPSVLAASDLPCREQFFDATGVRVGAVRVRPRQYVATPTHGVDEEMLASATFWLANEGAAPAAVTVRALELVHEGARRQGKLDRPRAPLPLAPGEQRCLHITAARLHEGARPHVDYRHVATLAVGDDTGAITGPSILFRGPLPRPGKAPEW